MRLIGIVLGVLALVTACGGGGGGGGSTETRVIQVRIEGGEVTPSGERFEVDINQPVDIVVTSDVPGSVDVHSTPTKLVEFAAGANDPIELQFDRPGVVEIELHEPFEGPVVELEVS